MKMLRLIALLACSLCASAAIDRTAAIIPPYGALVGASIAFNEYNNSISAYESQLTRSPKAFVLFFSFPLDPAEVQNSQTLMQQIGQRQAIAIVTLEPWSGLVAAQSSTALNALSQQVLAWERLGVTVIVRFAHEMNGSWYPWCQKPTAYKKTFQLVANAVKQLTTTATMLWAPNEGGGYPFTGGQYQLTCGAKDFKQSTSDCSQLDTNRDKIISMNDDMYTPYYPGDAYVDWVGLSVYHFGSYYPWGANNIPEINKFANKITGNYVGFAGDQTSVPNFYDIFCNQHNKPMIIGETAGLYNLCDVVPNGRGCGDGTSNGDELSIKQAWWRQVFAVADGPGGPAIPKAFPKIKLINWFDIKKSESEAQGNTVDWTISRNTTIRDAFLTDLAIPYSSNSAPYWILPTPTVAPTATAAAAAAVPASVLPAGAPGSSTPTFAMNQYTVVTHRRRRRQRIVTAAAQLSP